MSVTVQVSGGGAGLVDQLCAIAEREGIEIVLAPSGRAVPVLVVVGARPASLSRYPRATFVYHTRAAFSSSSRYFSSLR